MLSIGLVNFLKTWRLTLSFQSTNFTFGWFFYKPEPPQRPHQALFIWLFCVYVAHIQRVWQIETAKSRVCVGWAARRCCPEDLSHTKYWPPTVALWWRYCVSHLFDPDSGRQAQQWRAPRPYWQARRSSVQAGAAAYTVYHQDYSAEVLLTQIQKSRDKVSRKRKHLEL